MLLGLKPGLGLGPFALGSPLPEVLTYLQLHKPDWRCVEVKYADKDTLARDVLVGFPEHGFQLHFEPHCQRLRLVEVFDVTRLQMVYGRTTVFGGASHAPTFGRIYEAFGPTYPGEPESEGVALQYPGIMFLFPAGPAAQRQQGHAVPAAAPPAAFGGAEAGGGRGAPSFPVPLSVVADRIYVHGGTRGPPAAVLAASPPALKPGSQYMEPVEAVPCHGIYLGLGCSTCVCFGDSPQDVVSHLGQPARVVPKRGGAGAGAAVPDYFYGYPGRGLDLLFCGASHRLKKVVLHTNIPGHPDFNLYCKCNFSVHHWDWRPVQQQQQASSSRQPQAWPEGGGSGGGAGEDGSAGPAHAALGSVAGPPPWDATDASVGSSFAEVQPLPAAHAAAVKTCSDAGGGQTLSDAAAQPRQLPATAAQLQPAGASGQPGQSPSKALHQQVEQQRQRQPLPVVPQQQQAQFQRGQQQQQGQERGQQGEAAGGEDRSPGGFSQLVGQLAGFLGDVITLDPQKLSEGQEGGASVAEAPHGQLSGASGGAAGVSKAAGEEVVATTAATKAGPGAAAVPSGGKPPKPPTLAAAPALPAVATSKAGKKKKGGKKKNKAQAASAAAGGAEAQDDSDSLADASASDSGFDSSLASSPATSSPFPSHMPPARHRLGLASGYQSSDWGSTADLAGKEGSVGVGSAMDGWSDADDLLAIVTGPSPGPGSPLVKPARSAAAGAGGQVERLELEQGGPGGVEEVAAVPVDGRVQQQQELQQQLLAEEEGGVGFEGADASLAAWALPSPASLAALHQGAGAGAASALTAALSGPANPAGSTAGSTAGGARAAAAAGVQTVDTAVGEDAPSGALGGGEGAAELPPLAELEEGACWEDSGSPQGYYVIPDKPSLFDERAGAAEYERVPRQRDCSTQTPTHLLAAAAPAGGGRRPASSAGGGTAAGSGCCGGAGAVVTADSRLEDIEAAFGHLGGPALHSRLGCSHPFGPTYLYAYRGVVFEVLQNGLIATVTLFQP